MTQVMIPEKKKNALSQILPIAGGAVGAYYGGPSGAVKGYSMGSTAAGVIENTTQTNAPQQIQASGSAIDRRIDKINSDPLNTLSEAKQSLAYMPADIKEQYQKPIDDAYALALEQRRRNQERGMA